MRAQLPVWDDVRDKLGDLLTDHARIVVTVHLIFAVIMSLISKDGIRLGLG